ERADDSGAQARLSILAHVFADQVGSTQSDKTIRAIILEPARFWRAALRTFFRFVGLVVSHKLLPILLQNGSDVTRLLCGVPLTSPGLERGNGVPHRLLPRLSRCARLLGAAVRHNAAATDAPPLAPRLRPCRGSC